MYLQSSLIAVEPGTPVALSLGGAPVTLYIPQEGAGTAGAIIADPCISRLVPDRSPTMIRLALND